MESESVDAKALRAAPFATLGDIARSPEASALAKHLACNIEASERSTGARKNKRAKTRERLEAAVAGFVSDLLFGCLQQASEGWVAQPVGRGDFRGHDGRSVSYRTFRALSQAWEAAKLIERAPGYSTPIEFDPGESFRFKGAGRVTRFRVTEALLAECAAFGITPENAWEHFEEPEESAPDFPLALREGSRWVEGDKIEGRSMEVPRTKVTERLAGQVRRINDFLANHRIEGAPHRWFVRRFNMGDDPIFRWNKGGRLYSAGVRRRSYQQLDRDARLKITIDGERVCEIDIRASHLTILHARHGVPFEVSQQRDPYEVPGIPRDVVKAWVAKSLGLKKLSVRWDTENKQEYALANGGRDLNKDYPARKVAEKVCDKHPLLKDWETLPETWADLQWLESEAIISAMLGLIMAEGVPSLPVHDSLLVPMSAESRAREHLSFGYRAHCRVMPYLTTHPRDLGEL